MTLELKGTFWTSSWFASAMAPAGNTVLALLSQVPDPTLQKKNLSLVVVMSILQVTRLWRYLEEVDL